METYSQLDETDFKDYYNLRKNYLFLIAGSGKESSAVKFPFIAFDTEALRFDNDRDYKTVGYQEEQYLFNADFYHPKIGHQYVNTRLRISKALKWLFLKMDAKQLTILIHNATYDLALSSKNQQNPSTILSQLVKRPFQIYGKNRKGKRTKITLYPKKKMLDKVVFILLQSKDRKYKLAILDTTNFFKEKLAKIAKDFGNKTASDEYDYFPDLWNLYLQEKGKELVQQDTKLLWDFWNSFVNETHKDGGMLGISAASTALKTFKKSYLKENIWIPKELAEILIGEYKGGRVESYVLGNVGYSLVLDVNSLYPYVMKKYKYSTHPLRHLANINELFLEEMRSNIATEKYNYFVKCSWKFPDSFPRPILAVRNKSSHKLIFPLAGSGIITGNEYMLAYSKGAVFEISDVWEFANSDIFSSYVDHYFLLKKNAPNTTVRNYSKLMGNSLYGKFAQHLGFEVWHPYDKTIDGIQGKISYGRGIKKMVANGKEYKLYNDFYVESLQGDIIFPCMIAMEITANARLENWKIQEKLGFENVRATDTDSFHVPASAFPRIRDMYGDDLGQLKIEKKGFEKIRGLKYYEIKTFKRDLSTGTLKEITYTKRKGINGIEIAENVFTSDQWHTLKSKSGSVVINTIKKQMKPLENPKLHYIKSGDLYKSKPLEESD